MNKALTESFEVGDLAEILEPTLHVDEYKSKSGRDDRNCVLSFLINDKTAADDLVDFMERGYEFVIDADVSKSEVGIGQYLVFVEVRRLTTLYDHVEQIISELKAVSQIDPKTGWKFKYMKSKEYQPLTRENFNATVPLTPRAYRKIYQKPINDLKIAAGLPVPSEPVQDPELQQLQSLAGM